MSSPAAKSSVARRVEHVLRDMQDRIRHLEHRTVVQVGRWRLEEQQGSLVATHTGSNTRVVLATEDKITTKGSK